MIQGHSTKYTKHNIILNTKLSENEASDSCSCSEGQTALTLSESAQCLRMQLWNFDTGDRTEAECWTGEEGDKFAGNELSITNAVMRGSIYVMIRHNASIIRDQRQTLGFYLRDTIKRAKGWAAFEFLNFLRLSSMAAGAINSVRADQREYRRGASGDK